MNAPGLVLIANNSVFAFAVCGDLEIPKTGSVQLERVNHTNVNQPNSTTCIWRVEGSDPFIFVENVLNVTTFSDSIFKIGIGSSLSYNAVAYMTNYGETIPQFFSIPSNSIWLSFSGSTEGEFMFYFSAIMSFKPSQCPPDRFGCGKDKLSCYPKYLQCDGHFDCTDKADEHDCREFKT